MITYMDIPQKNKGLKKRIALIKKQNEELKEQLDKKNREILSYELLVSQQNKYLSKIKLELEKLKEKKEIHEISRLLSLIEQKKIAEERWGKIKFHFENVHPDFLKTLSTNYSTLTQNDLKHCAYLKMNLSINDVVTLTQLTKKSVEMSRYRLKKKLNLGPENDLLTWIQEVE